MEKPLSVDTAKARILMVIIQKMIARYQNSHYENLDEEIFKLFEQAKMVRWAEDARSINNALDNILER